MVGKVTPYTILTGTGVPILLNKNNWKKANELLQEAFNASQGQEPEPIDIGEPGYWGNKMEATIAQEACDRLGLSKPNTTHDKAIYHSTWPLAVSLDATTRGSNHVISTDVDKGIICMNADEITLEGDGCIECKLTGAEVESEPSEYRGVWQLQAQMACTGAKWGVLATLYKGTIMKLFVYERDQEMFETIRDLSYDFARRVHLYETAGETEWYEFKTAKEASKVFDEASEEVIELDDMETIAQQIVEIKKDIQGKHDELDQLQAQIMERMRDSKRATAGSYTIYWPMLNYKGTKERVVPAKPAYSVRQSKLRIKHNG
jgi:predicted phage-related endonuclease